VSADRFAADTTSNTRDASALAERVNAAKLATLGMLVAGVSHELNTPLGAIHSNHDVLERAMAKLQKILADERVDEDELDEVRRIVRAVDDVLQVNTLAVERMREIVASLRSFGRLDRAQRDRVDLREGIESTLALLAYEARGRGVELRPELDVIPPVECYPAQFNQMVMNLALNAVQASQPGGTVWIRTRPSGDGEAVVLEVSDDGVGIPPELRDRIFEPGFTTRGSRIGMGLGLPIVSQIAAQHDARIEIESEPGRGSVFRLTIPLRLRDPDP
jgi:two-component system, NtrC family, sensor kinase